MNVEVKISFPEPLLTQIKMIYLTNTYFLLIDIKRKEEFYRIYNHIK